MSVWLRAGRALNRRKKCAGGGALHCTGDKTKLKLGGLSLHGRETTGRQQPAGSAQRDDCNQSGMGMKAQDGLTPTRSLPGGWCA